MSDTTSSALHFAAGECSCVTSERWSRMPTCNSEELRRRFVKAETTLFRVRYDRDDWGERDVFLKSRDFGWEEVRVACCMVNDITHHIMPALGRRETSP